MPNNFSEMNEYLIRISKRIAALEVNSQDMEEEVVHKSQEIRETKDDLETDNSNLRKEIRDLRNEITELSGQVTVMLESFKRLARKEAFARLNRKIEAWNPEKLATHADLEYELRKFTKVIAYCVKCKEKNKMLNAEEVIMKNDKLALKGNCKVCGSGMFLILGNS